MEREEMTLEYEGDSFDYLVEKWVKCGFCGHTWESDTGGDRVACPDCNRETNQEVVESYHFYIKEAWWFANPEPSVEKHTEALRRAAKRLEALAAHDWELVETDGEHVYFERFTDAETE